jgi:hypothetical protein
MTSNKIAAVLKKHNVTKSVRANSGYLLSRPYEPVLSVSYYSHFTEAAAAGLDRVAAALTAEGIAFKRVSNRIVIK